MKVQNEILQFVQTASAQILYSDIFPRQYEFILYLDYFQWIKYKLIP